jgi:hypothetical protein
MVSIIIINYKQKDFLSACVESIYKNIKSSKFEVIIVNNSPEDDLSCLENKFPVKLISNKNKGFSNGNNVGAENSSGEFLFFLNADTVIEDDFLTPAIKSLENKNFGALGFKLVNSDATFQISFGYKISFFNELKNKNLEKLTWNKDKTRLSKIEKDYSELKNVDWVSGAALLIKKDVFNLVGGFDERFFMYMEDADICKRISDKGFEIFYYPFTKIVHLKGKNVNQDFRKNSYFYAKESQLIYYKMHRGIIENFALRIYLFLKFLIPTLVTFDKMNTRFLLLVFKNQERTSVSE